MSYITIALNHFRSLQQAAAQAEVQATLDLADFRLELKGPGRYFSLYPQFAAGPPERMTYTPHLTDQTTGFLPDTVLPPGQALWFDYRCARQCASRHASVASDNAWQDLPDAAQAAGRELGQWIGGLLTAHFGAPVLYALDAVVDAHGNAWWLEANTHPMVPPEACRPMLSSIFSLPLPEDAP